jgi:hypothetical protein
MINPVTTRTPNEESKRLQRVRTSQVSLITVCDRNLLSQNTTEKQYTKERKSLCISESQ